MTTSKTERETTAKNGYIERFINNRFNSIAVDTYILFDLEGNYIDRSIDYNYLHKKLIF